MKNTSKIPAAAKKMMSARLLLLGQWMQWEDPIARLVFPLQPPHSLPAQLNMHWVSESY